MADAGPPIPSGALERTELILEALETIGPMNLTEVAARTGLPISTAHRLLERLVRMRWLARNDRGYELGVRLFELGSQTVRGHWFHRAALPILRELHRRTGLVVHLGFLDGADTVYWERIAGAVGARVPTTVGGRFPAHRSAVGKAMLSVLPSDVLDTAPFGVPGLAPGMRIDDGLRHELATAFADRVAFDRSESISGLGCVATAVDYDVPAPAAVSVCGPASRVLSDRRLILAVQEAAADIADSARRLDPALHS
ncbi:IclR family transcriptional regulator [Gordonia neofelifaecis]|uniref:Iclr family transcriptional regulator n=1 Tax=Gordonia neofelifaecis NRRL B-59395 TaxID=644548 RepID=F1YG08_9ACTN|nr:IclR family transcriptional regulator [Gordonia neofelifaecis]EGD56585.1 iclr family transcriptional regulator [Gordonia neofelifaecis NRRL B-59395]